MLAKNMDRSYDSHDEDDRCDWDPHCDTQLVNQTFIGIYAKMGTSAPDML
jgi:hypothetical protein